MAVTGMAIAPAPSFHSADFDMAIYRLLELRPSAFRPDEISIMAAAYEDALRRLRLTDRSDPLTELVARKIIELANDGNLRDAQTISRRTVEALGPPRAKT